MRMSTLPRVFGWNLGTDFDGLYGWQYRALGGPWQTLGNSLTTSSLNVPQVTPGDNMGEYRGFAFNALGIVYTNIVGVNVVGATEFVLGDQGYLISAQPIDPTLPTLIATHGWTPFIPDLDGNDANDQPTDLVGPVDYQADLNAALTDPTYESLWWPADLLARANERLGGTNGTLYTPADVNLVMFIWPGSYTEHDDPVSFKFADWRTDNAARTLASLLPQALGVGYDEPLHMIGHSLGSIVTTYTVHELARRDTNIDVEQVTLLDAPLAWPFANTFGLYDESFFHDLLPPSSDPDYGVDWVDNYWGDDYLYFPSITEGSPAFGTPVAGAGAGNPDFGGSGGMQLQGFRHSDVHHYYRQTVSASTLDEGFGWSVLVPGGPAARLTPSTWAPPKSSTVPSGQLPGGTGGSGSFIRNSDQTAWQPTAGVGGDTTFTIDGRTVAGINLGVAGGDLPASTIELPLTFDANASELRFSALPVATGDGDHLSVRFNGTPLTVVEVNDLAAEGEELRVPLIDLGGTTGRLVVSLVKAGTTGDAEVIVGDWKLYDLLEPAPEARIEFETGHDLVFDFAEDVTGVDAATVVTVEDLDTGELHDAAFVGYDPITHAATFRLDSLLPDGNYRATLSADGIADAVGNAMAVDATLDFFVLAGDFNRNRAVNTQDLLTVLQNFGTQQTYSLGDANYDGTVNTQDLLTVLQKFGVVLPPPAAAGSLFAGGGAGDDGDRDAGLIA